MNNNEIKEVAKRISDKITQMRGYSVEIKEMQKINTTRIAFIVNTGNASVRPTVYLPDSLSEMDMEDINAAKITLAARYLLEAIDSAVTQEISQPVLENVKEILGNKELFLSNVLCTLINKNWNEQNKDWVSTPVDGDLEYIYYIPVSMQGMNGGVKILHEHIDRLNIDNKELCDAALKNTEAQRPAKIIDIHDMTIKQLEAIGAEYDIDDIMPAGYMFVVTNTDNYHGAAAITYPSTIKKLNDMLGDDYMIIPSSIHESIVLPVLAGMEDPYMLNSIVKEVNSNSVDVEERLSDHIYKVVDGELKSFC